MIQTCCWWCPAAIATGRFRSFLKPEITGRRLPDAGGAVRSLVVRVQGAGEPVPPLAPGSGAVVHLVVRGGAKQRLVRVGSRRAAAGPPAGWLPASSPVPYESQSMHAGGLPSLQLHEQACFKRLVHAKMRPKCHRKPFALNTSAGARHPAEQTVHRNCFWNRCVATSGRSAAHVSNCLG